MAEGVRTMVNLQDFKSQMKAFGADMEQKTFRSATYAATKIFRDLAIAEAPSLRKARKGKNAPVAGLLKRAIYLKRSKDRTSGREHYFVGVRQGKRARKLKKGSLDAFYWRWVEQGHLVRKPGNKVRGGRRRAAIERSRLNQSGAQRVPANPFLGRAFKLGSGPALQAFNNTVQRRIDTENRKRRRALYQAWKHRFQ